MTATQTQTKTCDLLISAAWVLPIAPNNIALRDHGVAVDNGKIIDVAATVELEARYTPTRQLALDHHIITPGLINAHGHAAMTLLRGAGEDQSLQAWLNETIWPLEARLMNAQIVKLGTRLAIAEMLKSGTTYFSDMYFFPEVVGDTASESGIGCQLAFPIIELENAYSASADECFHKGLALHDTYRHNALIDVALGPHAPYTVSAQNLEKVVMYAHELDLNVQIHVHENAQELRDAQLQQGHSNIALLNKIGLLGPAVQAVHMTQVPDDDLALLADTQTSIVHCPTSNMKLASGYCDAARLQTAGLRVGLGTDGAASNNRLDLFEEARIGALMAKHNSLNPAAGNAAATIRMATLGGAEALGIADRTGSLEVGKQADMIAINLDEPSLQPLYDPFAALLHGGAGQAVDHTFVNGVNLHEAGKLTRIDEAELLEEVRSWHRQIN